MILLLNYLLGLRSLGSSRLGSWTRFWSLFRNRFRSLAFFELILVFKDDRRVITVLLGRLFWLRSILNLRLFFEFLLCIEVLSSQFHNYRLSFFRFSQSLAWVRNTILLTEALDADTLFRRISFSLWLFHKLSRWRGCLCKWIFLCNRLVRHLRKSTVLWSSRARILSLMISYRRLVFLMFVWLRSCHLWLFRVVFLHLIILWSVLITSEATKQRTGTVIHDVFEAVSPLAGYWIIIL